LKVGEVTVSFVYGCVYDTCTRQGSGRPHSACLHRWKHWPGERYEVNKYAFKKLVNLFVIFFFFSSERIVKIR